MKENHWKIRMSKSHLSQEKMGAIKIGSSLLTVLIVFSAGKWFEFGWNEMLILACFGFSVIWKISSRLIGFLALGFLASCPVFLAVGKEAQAELMAIQAFYLLAMTVVLQVIELNRKEEFREDENFQIIHKKIAGIIQGKKSHSEKMISMDSARKETVEKTSHKKIAYIALTFFLLAEIAVVFLHLDLMAGIFLYLSILAMFSSGKILKTIVFLDAAFLIFCAMGLVSLGNDWIEMFRWWIIMAGALMGWIFLVGKFKRRKRFENKP